MFAPNSPDQSPDQSPIQPPAQQYAPARSYNVLSIVALVLAFFVWPAGIICGVIALRQIAQTGEKGSGLATMAVIVGILGLSLLYTLALNATSGITVN